MDFAKDMLALVNLMQCYYDINLSKIDISKMHNDDLDKIIRDSATKVYEQLSSRYRNYILKYYYSPSGLSTFIISNLLILINKKQNTWSQ